MKYTCIWSLALRRKSLRDILVSEEFTKLIYAEKPKWDKNFNSVQKQLFAELQQWCRGKADQEKIVSTINPKTTVTDIELTGSLDEAQRNGKE